MAIDIRKLKEDGTKKPKDFIYASGIRPIKNLDYIEISLIISKKGVF